MPHRKKQRSRLNSLADISKFPLGPKNSLSPTLTEQSIGYEDLSYEMGGLEECVYEESSEILPLGRTEKLIIDYLQFKAARSIQRYVRGWLYRKRYVKLLKAAIIIQKEWRRFYCQRRYFQMVEEYTQERIIEHFYRAAQKIQAVWRGWWVRQHVHDHTRLMRMQLLAGEDLLFCVAFKLHHLLRTHQIPGVYSLRNSNALSKVEQLLASLSFKTCNHHVFMATLKRNFEAEEAKKQHKKSAHGTRIPYSGPDILNVCEPQCLPLFTQKNADIRMAKILRMYEEAQREQSRPKKKKKYAYPEKYLRFLTKSSSFCTDVVKSMKRWKIIKENNVTINPNVFQRPEYLEHFLAEVESMLNVVQGYCFCKPRFQNEVSQAARLLKEMEDNTFGSISIANTNDVGSSMMYSGVTLRSDGVECPEADCTSYIQPQAESTTYEQAGAKAKGKDIPLAESTTYEQAGAKAKGKDIPLAESTTYEQAHAPNRDIPLAESTTYEQFRPPNGDIPLARSTAYEEAQANPLSREIPQAESTTYEQFRPPNGDIPLARSTTYEEAQANPLRPEIPRR